MENGMNRVLYIDDEPDLLEIGKIFLEQSGHLTIDTALSAPAAIELLKSWNYDGIISDYMMPLMNGIKFLHYVREAWGDLPFILFTGKGREDVVIEALNAGADFYLQKGGDPTSQFAELEHYVSRAVERKWVKSELQKSEQRYRAVVEDQTELISRFLPDGTHLFVNEAYCRYFHKKKEEILGTKFIPDIPVEDRLRVREHFVSLSRDTPIATIEHRIVMPDGQVRWQQWSDRAIFDAAGQITEYQSVGRDITDLKRAEDELLRKNEDLYAAYEQLTATEEELRQNYNELSGKEQELRASEERYRVLYHENPSMFFTLDSPGTVISVNAFGAGQLGFTANELVGQPFVNLFHDKDRPALTGHLKTCVQSPDKTHRGEFRIIRKDGSTIWVEEFARVLSGHEGGPTVFVVCQDVTERKKAEEALREREIQLTNAMDLANLVNWEFDVDSRMFIFNDRFYRLYGLSADEKGGYLMPAETYFRTFVHPEDLPSVSSAVRELQGRINSYHTIQLEHRIVRPDGEVRDIVVRLTGVADAEGRIVRHFGVNQDITERKKIEEELRRKNEELYAAYEELTATEEELRQNYDELVAMERKMRENIEQHRAVARDQPSRSG
jgi:PAS domain S-box-containing protein